MLQNRAIIVLSDKTSGKILSAESLAATNLVGKLVFTNGPSVNVVCFGDLASPQIQDEQISGTRVELICQDGMVMGMTGSTITFKSALTSQFLHEVQMKLANKSPN
jgi:hypothetical protein